MAEAAWYNKNTLQETKGKGLQKLKLKNKF